MLCCVLFVRSFVHLLLLLGKLHPKNKNLLIVTKETAQIHIWLQCFNLYAVFFSFFRSLYCLDVYVPDNHTQSAGELSPSNWNISMNNDCESSYGSMSVGVSDIKMSIFTWFNAIQRKYAYAGPVESPNTPKTKPNKAKMKETTHARKNKFSRKT